MKRTLLLIFTLLTVTLAAVAQPRISSNKETHNFGQIEWKKPVTVEYTITNTVSFTSFVSVLALLPASAELALSPVEDVLPHPVKTDVTIAVVSNNAHNFFALITNSSSFFFHAAGSFLLYLCDKFIIKAGKFWVNIRYFRNIQDFRVICCFMNS